MKWGGTAVFIFMKYSPERREAILITVETIIMVMNFQSAPGYLTIPCQILGDS